MSTVFDSVDIGGLRKAHFEQLRACLVRRNKTRWYYGDKKQFEKRHQELIEWVEGIIRLADNDVVIPKKSDEDNTICKTTTG